jgi:hypothetical protein
MIDALDDRPSTTFWIVGGAALLWNLVGLIFYYQHVTMTPEALEIFTPEQREFFTNAPIWATSAHAIAVNAGILGSLLMLLRKAWAAPLFALSLLAIVVQDLHVFLLSSGLDIFGSQAIVLPAIVAVIAIALVLYSRQAKARRWLT